MARMPIGSGRGWRVAAERNGSATRGVLSAASSFAKEERMIQRVQIVTALFVIAMIIGACGVTESGLAAGAAPTSAPVVAPVYPPPALTATPIPANSAPTLVPSSAPMLTVIVASVVNAPAVVRLVQLLRDGGLDPQPIGPSQAPWLADSSGQAYQLGAGELHIHLYASADAASAAAARIPPTAESETTNWFARPHFFRCEELIVLYLGDDVQATDALRARCGVPFAEMPAPPPADTPTPQFHVADLAPLVPTDLLLQLDYDGMFDQPEFAVPFGRVPVFTLLADGRAFYVDTGTTPREDDNRLMATQLTPDAAVALVQAVFDAGFARLQSHLSACTDTADGQRVCASEGVNTITRVRLPSGELAEIKNYNNAANDPAAIKAVHHLLASYRNPTAQPYRFERATLFLQRVTSEAGNVPAIDWPLDPAWLAAPQPDVTQWAHVLAGSDRDALLAAGARGMGDFNVRHDGAIYNAYLVPWLPGVDYTADVAAYQYPPRQPVPTPTLIPAPPGSSYPAPVQIDPYPTRSN